MLTTFERDDYVFEALRAGASGFLLKNAAPEELVHAVRIVAAGEALLAPSITRRVIEDYATRSAPAETQTTGSTTSPNGSSRCCVCSPPARATPSSRRSSTSERAPIKTHISHVLGKLGLRDRVQAVVFAYESGLVEPGQDFA